MEQRRLAEWEEVSGWGGAERRRGQPARHWEVMQGGVRESAGERRER